MVLTEEQERQIDAMPGRVGSAVRSLAKRNWFDHARRELQFGRNPGDEGWKGAFCRLLLNGWTTRQKLQHALVDQGLTPDSAKVQASIAISIFEFGGLVRTNGETITLRVNA